MSAVPEPCFQLPADVYGLPITTTLEAAGHYLDGIARLIVGDPAAEFSLRRAIAADPSFALGHAALGLLVPIGRHIARSLELRPGITRRERQHVEILAAFAASDDARGTALAREHLAEFPRDLLIVRAVAAVTSPRERDCLFGELSATYPGDPLFWTLRLNAPDRAIPG